MWKLKLFYLLLFAWNRCTYNFNFCAQRNKIWPTPLPPPSKKYNEAAGLICFLNIFLPCVSEIDIQDCRKMEGSIYRDTETWDLINSRHSEDDVKHEYKHARKTGTQYVVLFFLYLHRILVPSRRISPRHMYEKCVSMLERQMDLSL